ncbi:MAG TPA: hypothetical protein PKK11_01230 [Methanothrix sp.]|nr:hypothetical protein [Methanothrix sp.]
MMSHKLPILIISGKKEDTESAAILAMSRLEEAIKSLGYPMVLAGRACDDLSQVNSNHRFGCIILDADIPSEEELREQTVRQAATDAEYR